MRFTKKTGISNAIARLRREEGYNEDAMIKCKGIKTDEVIEEKFIRDEVNPPAETKLT